MTEQQIVQVLESQRKFFSTGQTLPSSLSRKGA